MTIEPPDAAWLPLRTGVLNFAHPKDSKVWNVPAPLSDIFRLRGKDCVSAAQLIQVICDRVATEIGGAVLTYHAVEGEDGEEASFDIYFPGACRPGDEDFKGFPQAAFRDVVASFRLGDRAETVAYNIEPTLDV
jgi:hypothetical protein